MRGSVPRSWGRSDVAAQLFQVPQQKSLDPILRTHHREIDKGSRSAQNRWSTTRGRGRERERSELSRPAFSRSRVTPSGSNTSSVRACITQARDVFAPSDWRSTISGLVPRRRNSPASAKPAGPAPTMSISVEAGSVIAWALDLFAIGHSWTNCRLQGRSKSCQRSLANISWHLVGNPPSVNARWHP